MRWYSGQFEKRVCQYSSQNCNYWSHNTLMNRNWLPEPWCSRPPLEELLHRIGCQVEQIILKFWGHTSSVKSWTIASPNASRTWLLPCLRGFPFQRNSRKTPALPNHDTEYSCCNWNRKNKRPKFRTSITMLLEMVQHGRREHVLLGCFFVFFCHMTSLIGNASLFVLTCSVYLLYRRPKP